MNPKRSGKLSRLTFFFFSKKKNPETKIYISFSAIYCTTGEQGAKRAKEGFDMVSCFFFLFFENSDADRLSSDWFFFKNKINVATDTGAITQAVSNHLSVAVGSWIDDYRFF